jgi:dephospho-CoA kinase
MKKIGLTGSIAMGKSTVALMLRQYGVQVFDADAAVHSLYTENKAFIRKVEKLFPGCTNALGVNRNTLAARIVADKNAIKKLVKIVHPELEKARRAFFRRNAARAWVVLDIPLLFEKKLEQKLDAVITVTCQGWQQRKRALERPDMSMSKLKVMRALQLHDAQKRNRADYVIYNGGSFNEIRRQLKKIRACILRRSE